VKNIRGRLLTVKNILNLLILLSLKNMPCFLAEYKKAFAGMGLAHLMTIHSQTYPQILGIRKKPSISWGLPRSGVRGRITG
jgi:hypothetical protein